MNIKPEKPRLEKIAPLTVSNIKGFIGLNMLVLGVGLYLVEPSITSFHHVGLLPIRWWSGIFFAHGFITMIFLQNNHWDGMKNSLLLGCVLKGVWVLQFISMAIIDPKPLIIFLMSFGIILLYIQANTFINFTPKYHVNH